ncbi:MAG: ATP-binding cassette domain-containing protein [Actinomycetota bacterium]|nr:ATP-binding cassette domain-containing protein [Actinomycetota bacterium]
MISLVDLTVQFGGVRPLDRLSATMGASIHGVIGPNGAGKTTLLNVLSGFTPCTTGRVVADGVDLSDMAPEARARWGLRRTFQTDQLAGWRSVHDNVAVMADTTLPHHDRKRAVSDALDFVGLDRPERLAGSLSVLERRLAELARALVGHPRLVLMDEPASGMVAHETDAFAVLVRRIPDQFGAQVVLIEHDMDLVTALCTEVLVLDFGRCLAEGRTEVVLQDRAVRAAWLGEADGA